MCKSEGGDTHTVYKVLWYGEARRDLFVMHRFFSCTQIYLPKPMIDWVDHGCLLESYVSNSNQISENVVI